MSKIKLMLLLCIFIQVKVNAQVKMGDNVNIINSASLLELETTNKGFVPPRVVLTSLALPAPLPAGLLTGTVVFNTAAGVGSGIGLYYWSGTAWVAAGSGAAGISGTGTTNFVAKFTGASAVGNSNIFDNGNNVGIGTTTFDATNPEKFLVNAGVTTSVNAITARGSINNFLQINIQNQSTGTNASSDLVATADNGTQTTNFVNLGINGSAYSGGVMGAINDAYLYNIGQNLLIGTGTAAKSLIFMTGGTSQSTNERMRILGSNGNVGIRTTNPLNALSVIATNPLYLSGLTALASLAGTDSILTIAGGVVKKAPSSLFSVGSDLNDWLTIGNAGTNSGINFLGTPDNVSIRFRTFATERMVIDSNGRVGIGTRAPLNALSVIATNPLYLSGLTPLASLGGADSILTISLGVVKKVPSSLFSIGGGSAWLITGNTGTNSSTNFVGNIDDHALVFKGNNQSLGFLGTVNDGGSRTSLGILASTAGQFSTAIGASSIASTTAATALGNGANASGQNSVAIGLNSVSSSNDAVALGSTAKATAQQSIAIGINATASNSINNIAIGSGATASVQNGIAIGPGAQANTNLTAMAIGNTATASGQSSTAIGDHASASASGSLAFGVLANSSAIAAVAVGNNTTASGTSSVVVGNNSSASNLNGTVVGTASFSTATGANVYGNGSTGSGANTLVIGDGATAAGANSTVIGENSSSGIGAANTLVIGSNSTATASNVILIGNSIIGAGQANALILGATNVNVGIGTTTPSTSTRLDVEGAFKLGAGTGGSVLNGIIRATVTLDPTNIIVGGTVTVTATVTGATTNATVIINPESNNLINGATIAWARVSAANTITVGFTGSGAAVDPPSIVYDVTIIQ